VVPSSNDLQIRQCSDLSNEKVTEDNSGWLQAQLDPAVIWHQEACFPSLGPASSKLASSSVQLFSPHGGSRLSVIQHRKPNSGSNRGPEDGSHQPAWGHVSIPEPDTGAWADRKPWVTRPGSRA
jgi:hypothetical protein